MSNGNPLRDAFLRQRRNLMIVSLVLLFVEAAELTINELNLLGNPLILKNPATITYALWVGFGYWLWRYYVYFYDLGDKGFLRTYHERMLYLVPRIALRKLKHDKTIMEGLIKEGKIKEGKTKLVLVGSPHSATFYHRSPLRYRLNLALQAYSRTDKDAPATTFTLEKFLVDAPGPMLVANVRAWVHVILSRHMFSEYVLPFAVAGLPVLYKVYTLI